jgi:hypothetical protein
MLQYYLNPNVCENLDLAIELKQGYLDLFEKTKSFFDTIDSFKEAHPEKASHELVPSYGVSINELNESRASIIDEFNEEIAKC